MVVSCDLHAHEQCSIKSSTVLHLVCRKVMTVDFVVVEIGFHVL